MIQGWQSPPFTRFLSLVRVMPTLHGVNSPLPPALFLHPQPPYISAKPNCLECQTFLSFLPPGAAVLFPPFFSPFVRCRGLWGTIPAVLIPLMLWIWCEPGVALSTCQWPVLLPTAWDSLEVSDLVALL